MASVLSSIKSSAVGQAVTHLLDTKQHADATTYGAPLDLSDDAAVGRFQEFLRIPTMTIEGSTSLPAAPHSETVAQLRFAGDRTAALTDCF